MFTDPLQSLFHKLFSFLLFHNLGEKPLKEMTLSLMIGKFSVNEIEKAIETVYNTLSHKNELEYKIDINNQINILIRVK
jgi:hypothetical protein